MSLIFLKRNKIKKHQKLFSAVIVASVFFAIMPHLVLAFYAGETLNPNCLPTDLGCDVIMASFPTSGANFMSGASAPAATDNQLYNVGGALYWNGSAISGLSSLTSLNGITDSVQTFAIGTSGADFNISSASSTHTFNLPDASAMARGLLTSVDWTTFNSKVSSTLDDGMIWIGNASSTATGVAISGDATISNAGVFTISNEAITLAKLAANAVNSAKIVDGGIVLADIADGSVDSAKIVDATITDADISLTAAILYSKLVLGNSIVLSDLTADSVNNSKIVDGSIIAADLASDAVTSVKILDGTITNADVSATAAIALSKLASGTSGQIIVANASGTPVYIALSGDAVIDNGGALTIANLAVTSGKLADGAVTTAKIADETIATSDIASDAIITAKILDANITTAKLADIAVTLAKLAPDSVDSSKIVDGSIVDADINSAAAIAWSKINKTGANLSDLDAPDYAGNAGKALAVNGSGGLSWVDIEGPVAAGLTTQYFRGDKTWATLNTLVVPENGNLYYTTARFDADFGTKSTSDLAEGLNFYYTDERARNALSAAGPLAYNLATGQFSISTASSTADGSLTSTDWTTFNNKQTASLADSLIWVGSSSGVASPVSLSGDAAITSTGVLTISDSAVNLAKLSANAVDSSKIVDGTIVNLDIADSAITNAKLANSSMNFFTGNLGADINLSPSSVPLGGTLTINIPDASNSARGVVTIGSQTFSGAKTFSDAPSITGFTQGAILFSGAGGVVSQNNNGLFWSNNNQRLGVLTDNPNYDISLGGTANRTFGMEPPSSGNGNSLTIISGESGNGVDLAGGNLILSSGAATGNSGSEIIIKTVKTNQGNGVSNRTPATIASFNGTGFSLLPYDTTNGFTGEARFLEIAVNGVDYVGFKAPNNISANVLWSLPNSDGTAGQVLTTDGAEALSWGSYISNLIDSGKIIVGNNSNIGTAVSLSGDAILDNTGALTIQNSAVTLSKMSDSSVNSTKIVDDSIVNVDINASADIALSKLANGANIITSLTTPTGSSANGGSIADNVLTLSLADAINPGLVSTSTQTFAGDKTFNGAFTFNNSTVSAPNNLNFDSSTLFIDANNNRVGIGTTTPAVKLDIVAANTDAIRVLSGAVGFHTAIAIGRAATESQLGVSSGANQYAQGSVAGDIILRTTGGKMLYDTASGVGIPALTLLGNNGNVGIGTTTPSAKLHVSGGLTVDNGGIITTDAAAGINRGSNGITHIGRDTQTGHSLNIGYTGAESQSYLRIFGKGFGGGGALTLTHDRTNGIISTDGNLRLTPTANTIIDGNVGVGTTRPLERLDVNGADPRIYLADATAPATTTNRLYSVSGDLIWNGINLTDGGALPSGSTGQTLYHNGSSWTASNNIYNNGGNVGIGPAVSGAYSSPDTKLHVTGNAIASTGDSTVQEILKLTQPVYPGDSKGSAFSVGLSFYEAPASNYPRTRVDFKTTGKTTDNNSTPMTVMSLRDDGNVGIGTTVPGAKLHIAPSTAAALQIDAFGASAGNTGEVRFSELATNGVNYVGFKSVDALAANVLWTLPSADGTSGQVLSTNGSGALSWATAGGSSQWTTSGSNIYYNTGNVGIGTATPSQKLHLTDTVGSANMLISGRSSGAGTGSGIFFHHDDSPGVSRYKTKILAVGDGYYGRSDLYFVLDNTNDNSHADIASDTKMVITKTGNVGIGTTTPNNKLQVVDLIDFNDSEFVTKLGYQAGKYIISGAQYNTFIGYQSGLSSGASTNAADYNTGIGHKTLYNNTSGNSNSALGANALWANTSGNLNSAMGQSALSSNTTGNSNSAMGSYSLNTNSTGQNNSAIGYGSLRFNTTGNQNSAVGVDSGRFIANGSTANATSNNSLYLGYDTRALASGDTNEIVIGASAIGLGSNTVVLGNSSIVTTALRGNVGIGTTAPTFQLQLSTNSAAKPSSNTWTISSDERIKKDIVDFKDGLSTVLAIRPVEYKYNGLGGAGYDDAGTHIGIIAQELEFVAPYMVETREGILGETKVDDFKYYQGHALPFILINAIKEQQLQIDELTGKTSLAFITSPDALFATDATIDAAASESGDTTLVDDIVGFIKAKIASGVKIARELVAERIIAARGYFTQIFAKEATTEKLCVGRSDNKTCITKDQLDALLSGQIINSGHSQSESSSNISNQVIPDVVNVLEEVAADATEIIVDPEGNNSEVTDNDTATSSPAQSDAADTESAELLESSEPLETEVLRVEDVAPVVIIEDQPVDIAPNELPQPNSSLSESVDAIEADNESE